MKIDTLPERILEYADPDNWSTWQYSKGADFLCYKGDARPWEIFKEAAAEIEGLSLVAQIAEKHALEIGDALDAKNKECFALAANQCHDGYIGEHGDHCCRKLDTMTAENERIREMLKPDEREMRALRSLEKCLLDKETAEAECKRLRVELEISNG